MSVGDGRTMLVWCVRGGLCRGEAKREGRHFRSVDEREGRRRELRTFADGYTVDIDAIPAVLGRAHGESAPVRDFRRKYLDSSRVHANHERIGPYVLRS